jgi:alkylation response protein AidB-like acyl-CoA dehydrogenase
VDFGLSEEQELLQSTVRGFTAKETPPAKVREVFDGDSGFDRGVWQGMVEMGLAGLVIPETYGGAGMNLLDLALVAEVLGASAVPSPYLGHALAGLALTEGGSAAQKDRWLPQLAAGEVVATVALGEEGDVWDPDAWALEPQDGTLSGCKPFVPNGRDADVIVVGTSGGGLALVERGAEGVKLDDVDGVDRTRRLDRLTLADTPADPFPSSVGKRVRDAGCVMLAADAFGGAWSLIEATAEYTKTRQQFGQPIAQFQAVKHKLSDLAVEIEPARGLYWYAAYAYDREPAASERAAGLAKAHLTDRFMAVARECVELHGGIGFTWECDVQIWFKRAMFDRAFLGDPTQHRARLAALSGW